jgi:hypothetical protein
MAFYNLLSTLKAYYRCKFEYSIRYCALRSGMSRRVPNDSEKSDFNIFWHILRPGRQ